jgi:hypothetical protein
LGSALRGGEEDKAKAEERFDEPTTPSDTPAHLEPSQVPDEAASAWLRRGVSRNTSDAVAFLGTPLT